jgi:hypothetical protein
MSGVTTFLMETPTHMSSMPVETPQFRPVSDPKGYLSAVVYYTIAAA